MTDKTKVKPQAKTQQKKRAIIDQALMCFVENGVEATSIEMLCQATNTSVGSLYHHFGNKDAIAGAVFIEGMRDFARRVNQYLAQVCVYKDEAKPLTLVEQRQLAQDAITALVHANIDWIEQNQDWARFIFQHRDVVKSGSAKQTFNQDLHNFYEKLQSLVQPMIEQGILRDIPMSMYRSIIAGPAHDYARHYLAGRENTPLSDLKHEFAQAAWQSLLKL